MSIFLILIVAALLIGWVAFLREHIDELEEQVEGLEDRVKKFTEATARDFTRQGQDWQQLSDSVLRDMKTIRTVHNETMKEWEDFRDKSNG